MSVRDRLGSYLPLYQSSGFSSHFMMLSSVKGKVRRQTLLVMTVSDYRNCKHVKNGEKEKKKRKKGKKPFLPGHLGTMEPDFCAT